MNLFTSLFRRAPTAMPVMPATVIDPIPARDPKVAFEVEGDDHTTIQVVYPCRTRHLRVEPEAQVYVLIYRDFGRALRYVDLHGSLRKDFGSRVDMWTVDTTNRRDDDLMTDAVADAKEILFALRHPVVAQPMPDPDSFIRTQPVAPVAPQVTDRPAAVTPVTSAPAPVHAPASHDALLVREGMYVGCGMFPWKGPDGQTGKPSFAVVIRRISDNAESKLFGSDLDRVVRDANVKPGDLIRLTKFPKTAVQVGARTIHKNIWQLDHIEEPRNARPSSRY